MKVGDTYGGEGLHNEGHALFYVVNSRVTGILTYPGPQSNGLSSQDGDCSQIIAEVGPWIVGSVPVDNTNKLPKAVIDSSGNMVVGPGYVDLPQGARWLVNSVDGVATWGDPPGTVSTKNAAKVALFAAAEILAA